MESSFSECCVLWCPHVSTKKGVFKNFHSGKRFQKVAFCKKLRFQKVAFSLDTCGRKAKTENKLLSFEIKTDACERGLRESQAR